MTSVITEITDNNGGIVLYDAGCAFCTAWARRAERILKGRRFVFQPLPMAAEEMKVVTAAGKTIGGASAVMYLARQVWWTWPLWALSRMPGMMQLLDCGYRWIAARRHCARGLCGVESPIPSTSSAKASDWIPMGCVLGVTFASGRVLPPWAWMWSLTVALFWGFKWITWIRAKRSGLDLGWVRDVGYWLFWPGMSPKAFAVAEYRARPMEWFLAAAKTTFGAMLIWRGARLVPADEPLLAGWVGLVGLAFLLHFGLMHLAALAWRVEPIMRAPILAESLRDFWSARWNTAFRDVAQTLWFGPMRRRWGVPVATFGVFIISGLLHELVISVPAHAGFGLPTAYFALQGLGMVLQRQGSRNAFSRRLTTWIVVVGPVFWLFHPPFIERVVVPFLRVIGALH
jgi:predicted DCC family thiol-disulfide oxidoreductase YuxK